MQTLEITEVALWEKPVFQKLLQLYLYDLSEYSGDELNERGEFEYNYLDLYWTEDDRYPYFIRVDGIIAGFVLIAPYVVTEKADQSIAEFFIMRQFRGKEIGKQIACRVFDESPGVWEVRALVRNTPAIHFWNKVIGGYTNNEFDFQENGHGPWVGPIWTFDNRNLTD